ncbi:hypothetical protein P280DRAFT_209234 [Massarina eburnea CBS 473.64]|uniref:Uncharacterized protein n=1 Tax=Massarina eburnea CBS 473.64 TaxID=1395130 RepID=A0A6A6RIH0_9PLEO|nr:hypothetical protein P280DRAFT_209234 [Massarina eburnea CBS 473.64]
MTFSCQARGSVLYLGFPSIVPLSAIRQEKIHAPHTCPLVCGSRGGIGGDCNLQLNGYNTSTLKIPSHNRGEAKFDDVVWDTGCRNDRACWGWSSGTYQRAQMLPSSVVVSPKFGVWRSPDSLLNTCKSPPISTLLSCLLVVTIVHQCSLSPCPV